MSYKQNCTKGETCVSGGRFEVRASDGELLLTADHRLMRKSRQEREANIALANEAFNVLHETGMTPRELVMVIAELLDTHDMDNGPVICNDERRSGAWAKASSVLHRA